MPNPNEREQHQSFEDLCGGPNKAFRLMRLYQECPNSSNLLYPNPSDAPKHWNVKNKAQIFRDRAKREGYTDEQVNAYLDL